MSLFKQQLAKIRPEEKGRKWLFIPYDQLSGEMGPLSREDPKGLGIVLVESSWKASRRPYHKQKLVLIMANLRHFALEQARRGVAVRHLIANGPYHKALKPLIAELGPLRVMTPAERELRADLRPLFASGDLIEIPHEGWLTNAELLKASAKQGPPWRMDGFYRRARRETGILMEGKEPLGGKFSYDTENRLPWKGAPSAPELPIFRVDSIKAEVGTLIERHFSHHPGELNLNAVPATAKDAEKHWTWAKQECLPTFGPYEDAMSIRSRGLFHTRISALLNIHRLLPSRVVTDAARTDLPLASKEGFIRQVLGWREFVHHVHGATDGFRKLPGGSPYINRIPGDGGYAHWAGRAWKQKRTTSDPDGGALPCALTCETPLAPAFWGTRAGLNCLDQVVATVWLEGYSHHITRLMILGNIATLLDMSARELTDWFWVAYADAFDWVVEPNVLGMGTYALGDLMTTKPYVSGAAYISRMSDFCDECTFNPKDNCPITNLYWAFLARHEARLKGNPRLRLPLASLRKRTPSQRRNDRAVFEILRDALVAGEEVSPAAFS